MVDFRLLPLEADEVEGYIHHRLAVAGRTEPLFTPGACRTIAVVSEGIPRNINMLCDTAMVYGMAEEAAFIDASVICEVVKDRREYGVLTRDNELNEDEAEPENSSIDNRGVPGRSSREFR
jgi:hypothetical protein